LLRNTLKEEIICDFAIFLHFLKFDPAKVILKSIIESFF